MASAPCWWNVESGEPELALFPARWLGRLDGWFSVMGTQSAGGVEEESDSLIGFEGLPGQRYGLGGGLGPTWRLGVCNVWLPTEGWALERPLGALFANLQSTGRAEAKELGAGSAVQWLQAQSLELLTSWVTSGSHLASSVNGDPTRPLARIGVKVKWSGPGKALDTVSGPS